MKKNLFIIVMALGAIACSREELPSTDRNAQPSLEQSTMTIIACTESSNDTKTALIGNDTDGYDVVWSEGDMIKIGSETFTLTEGAGTTKGVFSGNTLADGNYVAYYATSDDEVPLSQTYTAGKITNAPMHASVTVTNGEASIANFTNIGGLLHLTIKKVKAATIKSIVVSGRLNASDTRIFFDCSSSPIELTEEGSEFYIAMTEGTYTNFSVEMNTTTGETLIKTMSSGKSLIINRSQITNASFKTNTLNKHEFVNLGLPSGLLWATCNIGAGSPDEVGTYFAWGETKGKEGDLIFNWNNYKFGDPNNEGFTKYGKNVDGLTELELIDDAASKQWGEGWRMPTAADYQELIENCYWVYTHHYDSYYSGPHGWFVYKAKEDSHKGAMCNANSYIIEGYSPSDTHIFLPAGGRIKDAEQKYASDCYYWTSSLSDESLRCGQNLAATNLVRVIINNTDTYRYYGEPIRPVCE